MTRSRLPAAVRQITLRARRHVADRRPKRVASHSETRAALDSFRRALESGDPQGVLDLLAPEVVLVGDGGGVHKAALRPIVGADLVARFLLGTPGKNDLPVTVTATSVNGGPALLVHLAGELDDVLAARAEGEGITALFHVRNPEKLPCLDAAAPLAVTAEEHAESPAVQRQA